jgi:hypothetical protein
MSHTGHPADDNASGDWATSIAAVVGAVQRGPYAAMLAMGLLLIFAAFIQKIGDFEVSTQGSQPVMLAFGAVLCVIAVLGEPVIGARRRQQQLVGGYSLPPEANDVDFMFTMFYRAMPPAFVKKVENLNEATGEFLSYDILYSRAFDQFQEAADSHLPPKSEVTGPVNQDHHDGDARAIAKRHSYQIEFPPNFDGRRMPILTLKTHFVHKGHHYIAGWYVPVKLESLDLEPSAESITLRQVLGQIVLCPLREPNADDGVEVQIGTVLRSG